MTKVTAVSKELIDYVKQEIAELSDELFEFQHEIWKNPQLNYEEVVAHDVMTAFMAKQEGWKVTKHAFGLDTSFLAEFSYKPEKNPTVISFNAEYDALPEIGHACGHNLIAVSSAAGAVSAALAMKKFDIPGTVKLFGTPAEEGGGGKIKMLNAGAYENVDCSLMAHPGNVEPTALMHTSAYTRMVVQYFGKEAHAAAYPWEGINALDAMVIAYNAVSVLRQQFMEGDIIQCNIEEGGVAPNIISAHTMGNFIVRAKTRSRLEELKAKAVDCIKAGAVATGCKFKVTWTMEYYDIISNEVMASSYRTFMNKYFGNDIPSIEQERITAVIGASSDQGNVSWTIPSIHPNFFVESVAGPHNPGFTENTKSQQAHLSALDTGMCLGFTGLELLLDSDLLAEVKAKFADDMVRYKPALNKGIDYSTPDLHLD
ncbi:hypothetical protein CANARDRAFT_25433 [[Candida] arabinofermentans NRRL YB-2248]|uniref:Peptidase M20 domain-containing protein 2 n=1 Tax=[Candida] arabinofermentans NRRL YB-2248 TaxID=983967 RepID=A0A1E4STW7_9ASCO|nr:hypothetical protein CANARDRAFT_25433 [[Candida] arabinofermentans NRRL YB-2248]